MKNRLAIGLMSGTSMDGIDAALIESNGQDHIKSLGFASVDYDRRFHYLLKSLERCLHYCQGDWQQARALYPNLLFTFCCEELNLNPAQAQQQQGDFADYLYSDRAKTIVIDDIVAHSTHLHQQLIERLRIQENLNAEQITVIGYHGQSLYHKPSLGITIAVGHGAKLAEQLNITVIDNFRTADVAAGGQGAPFAPVYHLALAKRDNLLPCIVVNCGGIANLTILNTDDPEQIMGYDSGPGNGLLDRFIKTRTHGAETMDKDGHYGLQGTVDATTLGLLYQHSCQNFLAKKTAKITRHSRFCAHPCPR